MCKEGDLLIAFSGTGRPVSLPDPPTIFLNSGFEIFSLLTTKAIDRERAELFDDFKEFLGQDRIVRGKLCRKRVYELLDRWMRRHRRLLKHVVEP